MVVANGVVAAFGREDRSSDDVAAETGTDADALARIIRTLASRGVFEDAGDGRYRLTSIGRKFLPDEPGTIAGIANFKPWELHAWAEAEHTLRTGEPSFASFFELEYWEWLEAHPDEAAGFNDDMRRRTTGLLAAALPLFDWPHAGTVVDVGGGNGLLLERLLEREPELRGIVFDLPHVAVEAETVIRTAGLDDRVQSSAAASSRRFPPGMMSTYSRASCTTGTTMRRRASWSGSVRRWRHPPASCCSKPS